MPKTDDINNKFGIFESLCCGYEIVLAENRKFPVCPSHPDTTAEWQEIAEHTGCGEAKEWPRNPRKPQK